MYSSLGNIILAPKAMTHHQFYLDKFSDYPKERKAVFPFVYGAWN